MGQPVRYPLMWKPGKCTVRIDFMQHGAMRWAPVKADHVVRSPKPAEAKFVRILGGAFGAAVRAGSLSCSTNSGLALSRGLNAMRLIVSNPARHPRGRQQRMVARICHRIQPRDPRELMKLRSLRGVAPLLPEYGFNLVVELVDACEIVEEHQAPLVGNGKLIWHRRGKAHDWPLGSNERAARRVRRSFDLGPSPHWAF